MIDYKYFLQECGTFQKAMGEKSIMYNIEKRAAALKGLAYVYFNMQCTNLELESAASSFEAMVDQYNRRCLYIDMQGSIV